jgi:hypothetical protein
MSREPPTGDFFNSIEETCTKSGGFENKRLFRYMSLVDDDAMKHGDA